MLQVKIPNRATRLHQQNSKLVIKKPIRVSNRIFITSFYRTASQIYNLQPFEKFQNKIPASIRYSFRFKTFTSYRCTCKRNSLEFQSALELFHLQKLLRIACKRIFEHILLGNTMADVFSILRNCYLLCCNQNYLIDRFFMVKNKNLIHQMEEEVRKLMGKWTIREYKSRLRK